MDQFPLSAVRQVQVSHEHIARVEASPVLIAVPRLAVAVLAVVVVTLALLFVEGLITNRGEVMFTPDDETLILPVVNDIVPLACVEVARIEVAGDRKLPPSAAISHQPKEPMKRLSEVKKGAAILDRSLSGGVGR